MSKLASMPCVDRQPSGLESYLVDRLEGTARDAPWLDALDFHAAAKTCEIIGAVAVHGRTPNLKLLSEDDWQVAGGAGFDICAVGEAGVRQFLSELQRTYPYTRSATEGPQATFGRVYQWLAFGAEAAAFDPVRDVVRQHIIETMPVGRGDEILGRPVERRVLHSIRSASLEFGLHPKQLRKVLAATGVIGADNDALPDNRVTFDAAGAADILDRAAEAMTRKQAGVYLNADRVQIALLERHGFIKPFVSSKTTAGIGHILFALRDLDAFLDALGKAAPLVDVADDGMLDIPTAARRAHRSAAEIIQLILDGKLRRVERLADVAGYLAILVNVDEVKERLAGGALDGLTARMIQQELRTTHRVVKALIDNGHLSTRTVVHPVHRCPVEVVSREEFDRFRTEYMSLFDLAKHRGVHHLAMKAELAAMGVAPAMEGTAYGATFYRRAEIAASIARVEQVD